jgi:hypothetical protein
MPKETIPDDIKDTSYSYTSNSSNNNKKNALLFAAKLINKTQKIIKKRIVKVKQREAQELSQDVLLSQSTLLPGEKKLGTSTTPEKSKRSKVIDPEKKPSKAKTLLTFFRSKTEKSPTPAAGRLLEKGAKAKKEATAKKKSTSSQKNVKPPPSNP